jgi:dTDP-4-amino-4,6-dideoxygalactose transaminase
MIKYIQNKRIDYGKLEELLAPSEKTNQFSNRGPAKAALEKTLGELLDLPETKTVICTANGTMALHALFLFYRKKGARKFISPSFTFPSCAVGGFKTKTVDISLENYSFGDVDKVIDENDCLVITNLFGTYPKNLEEILEKCRRKDTKVILDNASSPLTTISGENICSLGDAAFGSLHHTKYLGFGEGGFIVIDKKEEETINRILGFGFTGKTAARISSVNSSNFKISDVSSASILQHISGYDLTNHMKNQNTLIEALSGLKGVDIFNYREGVVYGNLPLIYDDPMDVVFFRDNYIEAHKYYYPLKRHKNSLSLYARIINLPLHASLSDFEIEKVIKMVRNSVSE